MIRLIISIVILGLGVGWHMLALSIIDRTTGYYPGFYDIILDNLPYINLFGAGETLFFLYLVIFIFIFFKERPRDLPQVLTLLGIFYAVRGVFLLLIPIGAPLDAPEDRFTFYPFATHAYFPGGHIGIMFIMAWMVRKKLWQYGLFLYALLFGFGSMLTRAHYTIDVIAGIILAYAVFVWGERNLKNWKISDKISPKLTKIAIIAAVLFVFFIFYMAFFRK